MFDLQPLSAQSYLLIAAVIAGMITLSWAFNRWIDMQTDIDPLGSYSAVFTVMGVGYTLLGTFCILAILLGLATAAFVVGIVFACFGISGTPMIFGDMRRGGRRRNQEMQKAQREGHLAAQHDLYPIIEE